MDDAAEIARVHTLTWQAAYDHVFGADRLASIDVARREAGWARVIADGEAVYVAVEAGRILAFVSTGPARDQAGLGELYTMYALPEAWGSGAGPALMSVAKRQLLADGWTEAILWVVEGNPRARRFYEREGWSADGGRKQEAFLGVDVVEVRYRIRLV